MSIQWSPDFSRAPEGSREEYERLEALAASRTGAVLIDAQLTNAEDRALAAFLAATIARMRAAAAAKT